MASPDYFRKQAELCGRLADAADGELALRFKVLALDFLRKAMDAKSGTDHISIEPGSPNSEAAEAALTE